MHIVDPKLDVKFAKYLDVKFDAVAMQQHTAARMLQDPNAGLF